MIGFYAAVDGSGDPVSALPDLAALISAGWKIRFAISATYGQMTNPPSGPASTEVVLWLLEATAWQANQAPTVAGSFAFEET